MPYRHRTLPPAAVLIAALALPGVAQANHFVGDESRADCSSLTAQATGFPDTKSVPVAWTATTPDRTISGITNSTRRFTVDVPFSPTIQISGTVAFHAEWELSGHHVYDQSFVVAGCPTPASPAPLAPPASPPAAVSPPAPGVQHIDTPLRIVSHKCLKRSVHKHRPGFKLVGRKCRRYVAITQKTIGRRTVRKFTG